MLTRVKKLETELLSERKRVKELPQANNELKSQLKARMEEISTLKDELDANE